MSADPVAVIGATGRLGQRVARLLAERGRRVIAVGRDAGKLAAIPDLAERRRADLADGLALRDALAGAAAIVSCANARFAPAVLAASPATADRIVQMGSTRRFSRIPDITAEAVRVAEGLLAAGPVPGIILLAPMIYGAGGSVVDRLARQIRRAPFLPLPGADARVQPIHIDDVAAALVAATLLPDMLPAPLVIAGGTILTRRDLAHAIAAAMGRRVRAVAVPRPMLDPVARIALRLPPVAAAAGSVLRMYEDNCFDIEPMRRLLGIEPRPFAYDPATMDL